MRTGGPRFEFDVEQLGRNVLARKKELGLTFKEVEAQVGIPRSQLGKYFVTRPRKPWARGRRHMISMNTALKMLMWVGDYDIRDYCLEER